MSEAGEARARELERKGVNMDWYWRGNRQRAEKQRDIDPENEPGTGEGCGVLTMYWIEYVQEALLEVFAQIYTIQSNGEKHKLARTRPTKKTGDPVYWCESCGGVFKSWKEASGHWRDEIKDAPSE